LPSYQTCFPTMIDLKLIVLRHCHKKASTWALKDICPCDHLNLNFWTVPLSKIHLQWMHSDMSFVMSRMKGSGLNFSPELNCGSTTVQFRIIHQSRVTGVQIWAVSRSRRQLERYENVTKFAKCAQNHQSFARRACELL
jgi:hypothetical protein